MSDLFSTMEQHASYGVGRQMGEQLAANSFEGIDIPAVQAGLADAFAGKESAVSMEELQVAFTEISRRLQEAQEAAAEAAAAEGVLTTMVHLSVVMFSTALLLVASLLSSRYQV